MKPRKTSNDLKNNKKNKKKVKIAIRAGSKICEKRKP